MPTSTVKELSGAFQPPTTEPKSRRIANTSQSFFRRELVWLAARAVLLVGCGAMTLASVPSRRMAAEGSPGNVVFQPAQILRARLVVTSVDPPKVKLDVELPAPTGVLSFRNTYGGVLGLGERIEMLATGANGEAIRIQKLAAGEFRSDEKFTRISYEVSVAEPARPGQMPRVSWLNREHGLLMLMDLLPVTPTDPGGVVSAEIEVDVPAGWTVAANARKNGSRFSTDDPKNAVFLVGPSVHEKTEALGTTNLSIISSGKWPFSEKDAIKIARRIIAEYARITRFELKRNAVVMLVPYPGDVGPANWSAETRGNDVVLLLGRNASGRRALSRLGIVLSHELFHLWVPNSLQLAGDYDWFFEGFTLYQALRMDLRLGLISFDDYLETIARVYDSYQAAADRDRVSLIEASERRWTTSSSLVYEKGMLAAVIYDLSRRKLSDCRESLDDVYAELFRLSAGGQGSANETIIGLLTAREGLGSFAKDYVEGAGRIELDAALSAYGIQVQSGSSATKLVVAREPDSAQRKRLSCIGYRK